MLAWRCADRVMNLISRVQERWRSGPGVYAPLCPFNESLGGQTCRDKHHRVTCSSSSCCCCFTSWSDLRRRLLPWARGRKHFASSKWKRPLLSSRRRVDALPVFRPLSRDPSLHLQNNNRFSVTQPVTRCIFGDVTSPSARVSTLSGCCSSGVRVCIPLTSCFVIVSSDSSSCEPFSVSVGPPRQRRCPGRTDLFLPSPQPHVKDFLFASVMRKKSKSCPQDSVAL